LSFKNNETMDAVTSVGKEIDKVLSKFSSLDRHSVDTLSELIQQLNNLKQDLDLLTRKSCHHVLLTYRPLISF